MYQDGQGRGDEPPESHEATDEWRATEDRRALREGSMSFVIDHTSS